MTFINFTYFTGRCLPYMNKNELVQQIIRQLEHDLTIQLNGALAAHEASTHEENIPDNKYETLALEASYLAQGQANRAQEIRRAIGIYKNLKLHTFHDETSIALTALVSLTDNDNINRTIFIGPAEGGMKIIDQTGGVEIVVITPASPFGKELIGKKTGDSATIGAGTARKEFEIIHTH